MHLKERILHGHALADLCLIYRMNFAKHSETYCRHTREEELTGFEIWINMFQREM